VRTLEDPGTAIILVAHDVEETRDGIEALLSADGYAIVTARHEDDAVAKGRRRRPDLILVSFDGVAVDVILSAGRIRQRAGLGNAVPVVIFCVPIIDEGAEVALGNNVYITRPDNFDQLRGLIGRLLLPPSSPVSTVRTGGRTRFRRSDSIRTPTLPGRRDRES
jgi:DNA-binding response OmpR family regulator